VCFKYESKLSVCKCENIMCVQSMKIRYVFKVCTHTAVQANFT